MTIIRTVAELRRALAPHRATRTIGFVPTMGAFHEGHLALFRSARAETDIVVASLFVNPAQFGDPADLHAYPRDEARDAALAGANGVEFLFAPGVAEMYPPGFATWVDVDGAAQGLEGAARPGHFRGVATICLKLFHAVGATIAFFGQKDAQQVAVIQQMVRDTQLDLTIRVMPTVRDPDGLAMSSRNVRLSPEERRRALAIPRALRAGQLAHRAGEDAAVAARAALGDLVPDYVEVANFAGRPTLAIAVRVGRTRLIDNAPLEADVIAIS